MTYQCLRAIKEPCLSPVVTLPSPCFAASPREPLLKRSFRTKNNSVNSSLEQIKEESQMKQVKVKLTRAELDKNKKIVAVFPLSYVIRKHDYVFQVPYPQFSLR